MDDHARCLMSTDGLEGGRSHRELDADRNSPTATKTGLAHQRNMNAQVRDPGACSVELLTTYSHSTQAADLGHCHTMALTSPVCTPEPEREASVQPVRPPR